MRRRNRLAGLAGAIITLAFGMAVAVFGAELAARLMFPQWGEYDSERWTRSVMVEGFGSVSAGKPDYDGYFAQNNGDFRVHVRFDGLGLRNGPADRADDALWALGDSFSFGWGVERDETFGAVVAGMLGLPFYSIASPGTDIRGYLAQVKRLPQGPRPKAVVLGLTMENDLEDYDSPLVVAPPPATEQPSSLRLRWLVTKTWLIPNSAFYNVVAVTLKRSPLVLSLLTRLGVIERPFDKAWHTERHDDKVIDSTARALVAVRNALPPGTPFIVLVIPARQDVATPESGWGEDRKAMVAAILHHGLEVVDPLDALHQAGATTAHFAHDGHWSPVGHRIAGQAVARTLSQMLATDR